MPFLEQQKKSKEIQIIFFCLAKNVKKAYLIRTNWRPKQNPKRPDLHWKIMWEVDLAGLKHTHLRLVPKPNAIYLFTKRAYVRSFFFWLVVIDLI